MLVSDSWYHYIGYLFNIKAKLVAPQQMKATSLCLNEAGLAGSNRNQFLPSKSPACNWAAKVGRKISWNCWKISQNKPIFPVGGKYIFAIRKLLQDYWQINVPAVQSVYTRDINCTNWHLALALAKTQLSSQEHLGKLLGREGGDSSGRSEYWQYWLCCCRQFVAGRG